MCGIVGILGTSSVSERLLKSLKLLEYRGYDSAGIAVSQEGDTVALTKVAGCIDNLKNQLLATPINGNFGIGHTRWATHGKPEQRNAHPFVKNNVALVHNGIIENHDAIKEALLSKGVVFESDTDSEVILHLILDYIGSGMTEYQAVHQVFREMEGTFAIVVMFAASKMMIGLRRGAPLALGVGDGEMFLGSDALALFPFTDKIIYLDDNEIAEVRIDGCRITNLNGKIIQRDPQIVQIDLSSAEKGTYEHYMLKEIYEQPFVLARLFMQHYDIAKQEFTFPEVDLSRYTKIYLVACGTSFHAASVAKYWFEKFAGIAVEIDLASELRYRHCVLDKGAISIFLSQSGETADTVAALRYMKSCGLRTLALVNVADSTIAREADAVLQLMCGYEIGVASTKVFTAQLLMLAMLCLDTAHTLNKISDSELKVYSHNMHNLPDVLHTVFQAAQQIEMIAHSVKDAASMIYIGRGIAYPLALEGALKIKEVSYIHAEGIAAGELKHGSIALIDENLPIIAVAPFDDVFTKLVSNVQEVVARKGVVISITEERGVAFLAPISRFVIEVPAGDDFTSGIIYSVPMQLLAYYAAAALGKNVDQPRNLAKSVTVE